MAFFSSKITYDVYRSTNEKKVVVLYREILYNPVTYYLGKSNVAAKHLI